MDCKTSYVNGLCISTFLNKIGFHLGAIVNLHNDSCLMYIFTGKVEIVLQLYLIKHCIILGIDN